MCLGCGVTFEIRGMGRNVFVSGHLVGWNSQGEVEDPGSIEMVLVQRHYNQDDIVYDARKTASKWRLASQSAAVTSIYNNGTTIL